MKYDGKHYPDALAPSLMISDQFDHLILGSKTPGEAINSSRNLRVREYTTEQLTLLLQLKILTMPNLEHKQKPLLIHTENLAFEPSISTTLNGGSVVGFSPEMVVVYMRDNSGFSQVPLMDCVESLVECASQYDFAGTSTLFEHLTSKLGNPSFYLCDRLQGNRAVPIIIHQGRTY